MVEKGSLGPFDMHWWKDGVPVKSTSRLTVYSSKNGGPLSMLSLVDVTSEDSGNYTCVARNAAGSDGLSAYLTVTGMAAFTRQRGILTR